MAGGIVPVRQLRVIIRIDGQHAAASQLPGKRRFPRPRIPRDKEGRHQDIIHGPDLSRPWR